MTAHDPALVERLVQAAEDWLNDTDPFDELDAYDRERIARMLTGKHLDLLAAEGWLCEPDPDGQLRPETLRAALAEQGSTPNVTSKPPHRSDSAEPLIDPDCRDGKHSSCVGAPCECPECEHPR